MGFPYQAITKVITGTSAAYSANQVIGTGGIQVFPSAPFGGFLQTININVNSTNANQIDFCTFYSSMPNSTFTDHSSIAISSADFAAMGPIINVTQWNYMGLNATAGVAGGLAYAFYENEPPMYFCLVARGAVTLNSAAGISVTLAFVS